MLLKFLPLLSLLMLTDGDAADDKDDADTSGDDGDTDDAPEDTAALKNAYEREKQRRKQLAADLKAARDAQTELEALKAAQRKREEDEAAAQGEYKKLLDQRDADLKALQDQLAARDLADLRRAVAKKHNLPDDALEFVTGEDEDAIEASVKKLVKLAARNEDVDTDSGKRDATGTKKKQSESLLVTHRFGQRR